MNLIKLYAGIRDTALSVSAQAEARRIEHIDSKIDKHFVNVTIARGLIDHSLAEIDKLRDMKNEVE